MFSQQELSALERQAANGNAEAQTNLGDLYYDGRGVPKDYDQAALWFRKAAEQGNADAQLSLGYLYLDGEGVPQDATQAAAWSRKAADQGNARAQWLLGGLYLDGQGVPQDYAESYFWYDLAAAGEAGRLRLETGCEIPRRSRVSPNTCRSIPRTGAGAAVV